MYKRQSSNTHELLVFTNKSQVYKCKVAAFEDTKSAPVSYTHLDVYKRQVCKRVAMS